MRSDFWLRLRRYLDVAIWGTRDALWRFNRVIARIMIMNVLAVAMQVGALALLITYGRALETGEVYHVLRYSVDVRSSVTLVVAVPISALLLFVISAVLAYSASIRTLALGRDYEFFCSKRAASLASQVLHAAYQGTSLPFDEGELGRVTGGDAKICGLVLRAIVPMLPSTVAFGIFIALMAYLDAKLTLIVIGMLAAASVLFYRTGLGAAASTVRHELGRPKAKREKKSIRDALRWGATPFGLDSPLLTAVFEKGHTQKVADASIKAKASAHQSLLINMILGAFVLMLIVAVKGTEILSRGSGWGDLVAFLIAGRLAMGYFIPLTQSLTRVNRFYPKVARYCRFLERVTKELAECVGDDATESKGPVQVTVPLKDAEDKTLVLKSRARIAFLQRAPLDWFSLPIVARAFAWEQSKDAPKPVALGAVQLVQYKPPSWRSSIREVFALPDDLSHGALLRQLAGVGVQSEELSALPSKLDRMLSPEAWQKIPPAVAAVVALLSAVHTLRPLIILSGELLTGVSDFVAHEFLDERLRDRLLILGYTAHDARFIGRFGEESVLISDGETITEHLTVESFQANRDAIVSQLEERKVAVQENEMELDEDD